jgi:hypothetical protein
MTLPATIVGAVVTLTPTTVHNWTRCRRLYLLRNVLTLPQVDDTPWSDEGLKIHDLLRIVHEEGSCADRGLVGDVVDRYGGTDADRVRGFLDRHAARCPQGAVALGHEVDCVRFHREPMPKFLASARIDAAWVHDGTLDARDYKTGSPWGDLADDVRARVQAWVLAPLARERGLTLRLRYEYLAPEAGDDPPPFDPDPETLEGIEEELRSIADAMRAERAFAGVADAAICRTCPYRSICVDAQADLEGTAAGP